MPESKPIDLYTLDRILEDDRESIVRGLLQISVEERDVLILLKHQKTVQPTQNAIRYRIGQFLNRIFEIHERKEKHLAWVKKHLDLSVDQDRRLRRHARSVDQKVTEGMEILDVLKLPALSLRASKSRKARGVDDNLEALRSLRGNLQGKIVSK